MVNSIDNTSAQTNNLSKPSTTPVHQKQTSGTGLRADSKSTSSDQVNVSSKGHMAGTLNQAASNSDGVDSARVQAIRNQMANGSEISAHDIAAAMIKAHSTV